MKAVFFGTGAFGLPSLTALASKHELLRVVTSPDRPKGRGLEISSSPIKEWAVSHGIPVTELDRQGMESFSRDIRDAEADIFVVIAFGIILPQVLLDIPKIAPLNLHASLLPQYRGPAPIQWALAHGEKETGVSVIRMVAKLDAGDILIQKHLAIEAADDARTLHDKLAESGAQAVLESLEALKKGVKFTMQDEHAATYAPKIKKEDGRVQWAREAQEIVDRVRAFTGWPGSYFLLQGKRMGLLKARAESVAAGAAPGTVIEASEKSGLAVAAGKGRVRIVSLQAEGRKALSAEDFLKGFPLKPGALLE